MRLKVYEACEYTGWYQAGCRDVHIMPKTWGYPTCRVGEDSGLSSTAALRLALRLALHCPVMFQLKIRRHSKRT